MKPATPPSQPTGPDWCSVVRPPTAHTWVTIDHEKDVKRSMIDRRQRVLKAAAAALQPKK